jgi:hypothetical protein
MFLCLKGSKSMRAGSIVRSVFVAATLTGAVALVPGVASAAVTAPRPLVHAGVTATVNPLTGLNLGATVGSLTGLNLGLGATVGSLATVGAGVSLGGSGLSATLPIDVNVPGTVGGSTTCVSTLPKCIVLTGISDLKVTASVQVNGLAAPLITPAPVPNCPLPDTGVGVTITPSALGSADVTVDISDSAGSLGPINIPLAAGGAPVTITQCVS